jgi:hypothetical protein
VQFPLDVIGDVPPLVGIPDGIGVGTVVPVPVPDPPPTGGRVGEELPPPPMPQAVKHAERTIAAPTARARFRYEKTMPIIRALLKDYSFQSSSTPKATAPEPNGGYYVKSSSKQEFSHNGYV